MGLFGPLRRPSYLERQPNNLSQIILMWVDESFDLMFPADGEPLFEDGGAAKEGSLTWVTAANTVEIVSRADAESSTVYGEELEFGIEVDLVHVGNTSWRGFFQVHRLDAAGAPKALVARVLSRAVCVDRATLTPRPLPGRENLLEYCVAEPQLTVPQSYGARPDDAFLWSTAARGTDCDGLGHLNNTKYATLEKQNSRPLHAHLHAPVTSSDCPGQLGRYATYAQEALQFASAFGAFDKDPAVAALAEQPIVSLHIDYMQETKPYVPLYVAVWWEARQHTFIIEMRCGNGGESNPSACPSAAPHQLSVPIPLSWFFFYGSRLVLALIHRTLLL